MSWWQAAAAQIEIPFLAQGVASPAPPPPAVTAVTPPDGAIAVPARYHGYRNVQSSNGADHRPCELHRDVRSALCQSNWIGRPRCRQHGCDIHVDADDDSGAAHRLYRDGHRRHVTWYR